MGGWHASFAGLYERKHLAALGLAGVGLYNLLLFIANRRGLWEGDVVSIDVSLHDLHRLTGSSRNTLRRHLERHQGVYWIVEDGDDATRPTRITILKAKRALGTRRGGGGSETDPGPKRTQGPKRTREAGPKRTHLHRTEPRDSSSTKSIRPEFEHLRGRHRASELARHAHRLIEWHAGEPIAAWRKADAQRIFGALLRNFAPEEIATRLSIWVEQPFTRRAGYRLGQFETTFNGLRDAGAGDAGARWLQRQGGQDGPGPVC